MTHVDPPGQVIVTSSTSTSESVTIKWLAPLDENREPHQVEIKYYYKDRFQKKTKRKQTLLSTSWTIFNLKSDQLVRFRLKAINRSGIAGPITYVTIRTKHCGK